MSFYIIEGPNGSGKTTMVKKFREKQKEGLPFVGLSSPGETELGIMLRPACRGVSPWEHLEAKVQFMLFSAVRYDQYVKIVKDSNKICVADRWWTSTYVYQCQNEGIPVSFLEHTIHEEEKIDGVFLLVGDPDILIDRVLNERVENKSHGVCKWTQEKESMKNIMNIYKNDLPKFLNKRNIPVFDIDVTSLSIDEVFESIYKNMRLENE